MPPAKSRPSLLQEDYRSDGSITRDRQAPSIVHTKKNRTAGVPNNAAIVTAAATRENGSALKELALVSTEAGDVIAPGQGGGMQWNTVPLELLNEYRITHSLSAPAAFTSPLNQALLTNPGIGRQSPTMARRKDKRRVSKEQLAINVRKHFNGAAVNEIDVVVELMYKVKNQNSAFRMRSFPVGIKKS